MFTYKYCPKCQTRNHKKSENCVRCGDKLLNDAKFGKNVFVITLSIVILLSSATVFASKSYFNQKSDNNGQPTTQEQNTAPKQGETKPTVNPDATTGEIKSEPTATSTNTKIPTTTQTTPSSITTPVTSPVVIPATSTTPTPEPEVKTCDVSKKDYFVTWYNEKIDDENYRYKQETDAIKEDYSRRGLWCQNSGACQVELDHAKTIHDRNIRDIDNWLQSSLDSINCSN